MSKRQQEKMEEESLVLALSDGSEVELVEAWTIDDESGDSYPEVEIYDCETNHLLGSYRGTLPDIDDDDFSSEDLIELVERIIW